MLLALALANVVMYGVGALAVADSLWPAGRQPRPPVVIAAASTPSTTVPASPTPTPRPLFTPTPLPPEPTATPLPPTVTPPPTLPPTATPTRTPTATATPTSPPPTATPTPTASPTATVSPTAPPTASRPAAPTPVPTVALDADVINVLLIGMDRQPGQTHWRTDTLIVASLNPKARTLGLLSIPRDLYVYIPGVGYNRINVADFYGELRGKKNTALLRETILHNLGFPIHHFVRGDFQGFVRVVDTLGGVDVEVTCPIDDVFPDPASPTGTSEMHLTPGIHHLDGKTALYYSRSRLSTSDYDRSRRQQAVLRGLWAQAIRLNVLPKVPELWNNLSDATDTDLNLSQIIALAYAGSQLQPQRIKSRYLDWRIGHAWTTPQGAWVLVPEPDKLHPAIAEFFAPPDPAGDRLATEGARIEVLDGGGQPQRAELAAARLRWQGFNVVSTGSTTQPDYANTAIIDLHGDKPYTIERLRAVFRLAPAAVQQRPDPTSPLDIRVVVGPDFNPCRR